MWFHQGRGTVHASRRLMATGRRHFLLSLGPTCDCLYSIPRTCTNTATLLYAHLQMHTRARACTRAPAESADREREKKDRKQRGKRNPVKQLHTGTETQCQKHRDTETKTERERESGLASTCCTPLSVSSPLFLFLFRCLHGTVLLDMVWIIWQLVWTSTWQLAWKVGSTLRCRMVLPEVRHWELVESYGLQTLCECRERRRGYPAVVNSRKNCCLGEDAGWYGRRRASLSWQESFGEQELEKLQRKLNGPKKTAKHIEAKQNFINRESKRLEAESARLTEMQESLRVRKETFIESGLRGNQDSQRGPF